MKRIVITGMGAVTPIGIGVDTYWNNLVNGISGIDFITNFDTSGLPVKIAAELKGFNPLDYISKKQEKELSPFMQYAYIAASEAFRQSGFEKGDEHTAITMGTALDGISTVCETQQGIDFGKASKVSPRFIPKVMGNICASVVSIEREIKGPSMTVNTACSSGADAFTLGCMFIESGQADIAVVMGAESIFCSLVMAGLAQSKALSLESEDIKNACKPFDLNRNGFVMGEGGGAMIIETEEHALSRGAVILAEVAGYANTSDAYHITHPHPEGDGAARCMRAALKKAGMRPEQVEYINAHGTSTKVGDAIETKAIKEVFGSDVLVSSTKGATGHLMGAGGITELIACVNAVNYGVLPPTLNYNMPDPECDLNYIPNNAVKKEITAAASNAFGFGGQNSTLIVKKYFKEALINYSAQ